MVHTGEKLSGFFNDLSVILNTSSYSYLKKCTMFNNFHSGYYYHLDKEKTEKSYHQAYFRKIKVETSKNIYRINAKMVMLKQIPNVYFSEYIDLENFIFYYSKLLRIGQSFFEWDYKFFKF